MCGGGGQALNVEFALALRPSRSSPGKDYERLAVLFVRGLAVGFGVVKVVLLQAEP